jgi:hypothetical protein
VKNAADVSLIIDAVELITKRPDITTYVIVSGDGIFAFLAKKLHEHGKRVVGCGFTRNANIIFRNACDYYISLEKSDKSLTAVSRKSKLTRPSALAITDVNESTAENIIPRRFPKSRFPELLAEADLDIWTADKGDVNSGLLLLRDVVNVLFSQPGEETAALEISVFKTYVDYYIPGFKISDYKTKRFNEFISLLLTNSPYCLYAAESNILKIAKREDVTDSKTQVDDKKGLVITVQGGQKLKSIFDVPEGLPFTYTITQDSVKKPLKPRRKAIVKTEPETPETEPIVPDEGSVRKWIKKCFEDLAENNILSGAEAKRMTTVEYSNVTFGVRTAILREVLTRSNLQEQRLVSGKVKYWKETFKFNNKIYLVYKEWNATIHRERFAAWINKMHKETNQ